MTKKSTIKRKPNETARLGRDPFADLEINSGENESEHSMAIETDEQPMEMETKRGRAILYLPSHFSIVAVEEVYGQMSSLLEMEETSIEVETTEVESIDTAALQLLYAFTEQIRISGKNILWRSHSEKIDAASRILNMNILIGND